MLKHCSACLLADPWTATIVELIPGQIDQILSYKYFEDTLLTEQGVVCTKH